MVITQEEDISEIIAPRSFDEGVMPSGEPVSSESFQKLESAIFASRPDIKTVVETHGQKTFFEYSKSHVRENRNPVIKARKPELHKAVYEDVLPLLGSKIAASVVKQLKGNDSVSTIQHGVPLGHPYILSAVFQNALPYFGAQHPNLQNVIVLSNSLSSFNNYSSPKADALHVLGVRPPEIQQLNLFGQSHEALSPMFHEPYGEASLGEVNKRAQQMRQNGKISKSHMQKLTKIIDSVFTSPHVLSQPFYTDQLTVVAYHMWEILMRGYSKFVPNLVFLSQESVTLRLLVNNHMHTDSILGKLLFDPQMHELFKKHFDSLNGAFNSEKNTGTFLFWYLSKESGHREQLYVENGMLKSAQSNWSIQLNPDSLKKAIDENQLIPTTSLVFITLAFYYGLFLGGGIAQVANITALKVAYEKLLKEAGLSEEEKALEGLIVENMVLSRPTFMYMNDGDLRLPVSGLDIAVYSEGKSAWDQVIESTKQVTVGEIIKRLYPFYYSQFVKTRDESLSKITERDVEVNIGLADKIPALFNVSKDS